MQYPTILLKSWVEGKGFTSNRDKVSLERALKQNPPNLKHDCVFQKFSRGLHENPTKIHIHFFSRTWPLSTRREVTMDDLMSVIIKTEINTLRNLQCGVHVLNQIILIDWDALVENKTAVLIWNVESEANIRPLFLVTRPRTHTPPRDEATVTYKWD